MKEDLSVIVISNFFLVIMGIDLTTKTQIAMKFEPIDNERSFLTNEAKIYDLFHGLGKPR